MTIQFDSTLLRSPIKEKSDNWQDTSYQWKVKINDQAFDYYTGSALVKIHESVVTPIRPTLDDVLYSLLSDCEACNMAFSEWADTLGYDTNNVKARDIYFACQENAVKLQKAGINIAIERERLLDY